LDGAVGDIEIMADRMPYAEFTLPYIESVLVMVVTVKPDKLREKWLFFKVFTKKMWLLMVAMHLFIGFVIWLKMETILNLRASVLRFGFLSLSFSSYKVSLSSTQKKKKKKKKKKKTLKFTFVRYILGTRFELLMSFHSAGEPIKNNLSRFVLAPWFFMILIVSASFTASLTSRMTVTQFKPSVLDIETLQRTNAPVGCNENSFIVRYLINVLNFKPENIRGVHSINNYPQAFE
jgi:hypothetical protein